MPFNPITHLMCRIEMIRAGDKYAHRVRAFLIAAGLGSKTVTELTAQQMITALRSAINEWHAGSNAMDGLPSQHAAEWTEPDVTDGL